MYNQLQDYTIVSPVQDKISLKPRKQGLQCFQHNLTKPALIVPATPLKLRRKNIMQIEIYTTEGWIPKLKYERLV